MLLMFILVNCLQPLNKLGVLTLRSMPNWDRSMLSRLEQPEKVSLIPVSEIGVNILKSRLFRVEQPAKHAHIEVTLSALKSLPKVTVARAVQLRNISLI